MLPYTVCMSLLPVRLNWFHTIAQCPVCLGHAECSQQLLYLQCCTFHLVLGKIIMQCVSYPCVCPGQCSETKLWYRGPSRCCKKRWEHSSPQTWSCRTSSAWWAPLLLCIEAKTLGRCSRLYASVSTTCYVRTCSMYIVQYHPLKLLFVWATDFPV